MILYQVNIITEYKNFLTIINLQPLVLFQFVPKEYKQLGNSKKPLFEKKINGNITVQRQQLQH
jgi:hypothetical protein